MKSPLHELHEELGATFTTFSGYEMPLKYTSIQDEHINVRKNVGIFDVSHMGNLFVRGKDAGKFISKMTATDAGKIDVGMGAYTVVLRDDGTIIDDEVFLHINDDEYMFIPNAGRSRDVEKWFVEHADGMDIEVEDVSQKFVIIAVQGPLSGELLREVVDFDLDTLGFFACSELESEEGRFIVSRTGYTGEKGYEFYVTPTGEGERVFREILEKGERYGIKAVGLGARDTLRLEKGFALAGNEFAGGRTPLEAGLGWLINWEHDFIGKEALLRQKEGDYDRLVFLECMERGIPRHGHTVEKGGTEVGIVTSGTFSPCLKRGIAMAYVRPEYRNEDEFDIVSNGRKIGTKRVKPPFVKKGEC